MRDHLDECVAVFERSNYVELNRSHLIVHEIPYR